MFQDQKILPAISNFKNLKEFLKSDYTYCIIMDFQLAEIEYIIKDLKENNKKVLVHVDLIKGLTADEYGAIHLIQNLKVDGLISIKPRVMEVAKKRNVISMQRIFLKDSLSFQKSLDMVNKTEPDCLEVLPAISGELIQQIKDYVHIDVYCGGLISSKTQIENCMKSGASGVTVSNTTLWKK